MAAKKVAAKVATGQTYGTARKQMEAQRTMAIAPAQGDVQAQAVARSVPAPPAAQPVVSPGSMGDFTRPTDAPAEPPTAGAPFGAGPGPSQAGIPLMPRPDNNVLLELRAIYQQFPDDDLADMIDTMIREGF